MSSDRVTGQNSKPDGTGKAAQADAGRAGLSFDDPAFIDALRRQDAWACERFVREFGGRMMGQVPILAHLGRIWAGRDDRTQMIPE